MSLINCKACGETHDQDRTCARPPLAERTGSAICTRCGSVHRRMPLDYLAEYMCSMPIPGTEIPGKRKGLPCGGSLEPKRRAPNAPASATKTNHE